MSLWKVSSLFLMAFTLVACGAEEKAVKGPAPQGPPPAVEAAEPGQAEMRAVEEAKPEAEAEMRLVSFGPSVTETLYDLGVGEQVVAVDRASVFPEAAAALPKVGLRGALSIEGVAAQKPSLIVSDASAPKEALEQLEGAGLKVALLEKTEYTLAGAKAQIEAIAKAVQREEAGAALAERVEKEASEIIAKVAEVGEKPRALFLYARGQRTLLIAGENTAPYALIEMAGGVNAAEGIEDFRPMSAEAVLMAKPDIILIPQEGLDSLGGVEGLFKIPGIGETPAAADKRVLVVDELEVIGFGPRLVLGLEKIAKAFHPSLFEGDATP